MKFILSLALIVAAHGASLRESVQNSLSLTGYCQDILNTWWDERTTAIATMTTSVDSPTNTVCNMFNGNWDACTHANSDARKAAVQANAVGISSTGLTTAQADDARCAMLGAHSTVCTQNNCNNLNEGSCTLQATGGLCIWFPKSVQGIEGVPGYGCWRNPCNLGNAPNNNPTGCGEASVPGINLQCIWCKGGGHGMGCQAVLNNSTSSTAQCAPINSGIPARSSIFEQKSNVNCQCTTENNFCSEIINSRSSEFVRRFP